MFICTVRVNDYQHKISKLSPRQVQSLGSFQVDSSKLGEKLNLKNVLYEFLPCIVTHDRI